MSTERLLTGSELVGHHELISFSHGDFTAKSLLDTGVPPATFTLFSDASLQAEIDRALASTPDGHGSAILDINVEGTEATIQGAIVKKVGPHWSIAAAAEYHFGGKPAGKIAIRGTF